MGNDIHSSTQASAKVIEDARGQRGDATTASKGAADSTDDTAGFAASGRGINTRFDAPTPLVRVPRALVTYRYVCVIRLWGAIGTLVQSCNRCASSPGGQSELRHKLRTLCFG